MRKRQKKKLTQGLRKSWLYCPRNDWLYCPRKWRRLKDAGYARAYMGALKNRRMIESWGDIRLSSQKPSCDETAPDQSGQQ